MSDDDTASEEEPWPVERLGSRSEAVLMRLRLGWLLRWWPWTRWRIERRRFIRAARPPGCVRPVTVYGLMMAMFVGFLVMGLALGLLYWRTQQVCKPLRAGEDLGKKAATAIGRDFANTFGGSADKLGCPR